MPSDNHMDAAVPVAAAASAAASVAVGDLARAVTVDAPHVQYGDEHITSVYTYNTTVVERSAAALRVVPVAKRVQFRVKRRPSKLGVLIVGWGGNNGTTVTAGILANKHGITWETKDGVLTPNYYGSVTQSSTVRIGMDTDGNDVNVPLNHLLPMVNPNDVVLGGWDISAMPIYEAMRRAKVIDIDLQHKLQPYMADMRPMPSIYVPDFIAANQLDRADNLLTGTKREMIEELRRNIRDFKAKHSLDQVIVLWSANTERFCGVEAGLNETMDELMASIERNEAEVSPSTLFAVAAILEGSPYINGSPQNTFVPGLIELAEHHKVPIGGDDFKTGQTKFKSVLTDFLISSGIKPTAIVSYNHLGNNDGKNLSAPQQFRSKEISKSNVVDDMVASNSILYAPDEKPDHCVVIKYVPYVGDSKRALDEYSSEIFLHGLNTIVVHNTCEDSLLAAPIIIDLFVMAELMTRVEYRAADVADAPYEHFHPVMSILGFLLKAPVVPPHTPVVNALFKQRACIENVLRACIGLQPENNMLLEHKTTLFPRSAPSTLN